MRNAFVKTLTALAEKDKRIFLLTGDLGFSVFEDFRKKFPDRFFNMGVAEANMVGVAAGLALSGKIVFIYSIVPFATMRPFEQIRNDLCYQNANVKIVGVGSGLSYGSSGPTHHATEDISVMRSLPNMVVACPGDPVETGLIVTEAARHKGPVYIRLGRTGEKIIHKTRPALEFGKSIRLAEGKDATIIATGNMLETAENVRESLAKSGVLCGLLSMHTVKPLDAGAVLKAAKETGAVFTIEEHSRIGGLGSAVSEVLAESGAGASFRIFALPDEFTKCVGSQKFLLERASLSVPAITKEILGILKK